ncbi:hypothetical protein DFH27DRAFT_595457 [Peziza echinospora]|nr:hypothetical protein DFH27DRAFT_595457 [Peziza echinospora]
MRGASRGRGRGGAASGGIRSSSSGRGGSRGGGRGGSRGGGPRGGASRGAGGGRGRGRGAPRGGARGRGRGAAIRGGSGAGASGPRDIRKAYNAAPPSDDSEGPSEDELSQGENGEDEEEDDESDVEEEEEDEREKPYAALLQSLKSSMRMEEENDRKSKRRKIEQAPEGDEEGDGNIYEAVGSDDDEVYNSDESGDEEEEEVPELNENGYNGDSDDEDATDPFETHFNSPNPKLLLKAVESAKRNEWHTTKAIQPIGEIGRMIISMPEASADPDHMEQLGKKTVKSIMDLKIKPRLQTTFSELKTPLQKALAPTIFTYTDLLLTTRSVENTAELRHLYSLHALNHLHKTRDRVLKNTAKLTKLATTNPDATPPDLRDQGFTRPKVLILAPTRNAALLIINSLTHILQPTQQENRKKLLDSFGIPADTIDPIPIHKPTDFRALFEGNHDDMFTLGIKLTKKTIKYFSKFVASDIIIASPLGLRMAIGATEEEVSFADDRTAKKKHNKKQDYDFLSSIEMCIVDHADAILMQNWEHLEFCFKHMNLLPKNSLPDTDFSRVREWCLDGTSPFLRQTILLSSFLTPEIKRFGEEFMTNALSGKVRTVRKTWDSDILVAAGSSTKSADTIPQIFNRFDSSSPLKDPTSRFEYFTKNILPAYITQLRHLRRQRAAAMEDKPTSPSSAGTGLLIFIPSYFDFLRIRTHLSTMTPPPPPFGAISEDTPPADVARARSHFLSGRYSLLLYSGRAHHFRRYVVRGAGDVLFYAPPQQREFYAEIIAGGEDVRKVRTVFSRWDALALERVVGSERVKRMVTGVGSAGGDVFEFV